MTTVKIAKIICPTEAEGPGKRMAIWVQGCPLRCPGCCNPEMLGDSGGETVATSAILENITAQRDNIEGITFLGGEPFAQAAATAEIARGCHALSLSVMVFSGFERAQLESHSDPDVGALLAACDLLVDGPYDRAQPDEVRRWIGSRNQVMHFLSDRYQPSDSQFVGEETFEIRFLGGQLTVNGWPASSDHVASLLARRRRDVA